MTDLDPVVFVLDDEPSIGAALEALFSSVGLTVRTYDNADTFFAEFKYDQPSCLVLDVRMPGINGLELQRRLRQQENEIPIVVMTGHVDVDVAVAAFRGGAFDFIEKPFSNNVVLEIVQRAIAQSELSFQQIERRRKVLRLLERLTPREVDVMSLLRAGASNKEIARALNISPRTAEHHRQSVLTKLEAHSATALANTLAIIDK